jgi:hypothetical protein
VHYSITRFLSPRRISWWPALLFPSVLWLGCSGPAPLTVDMPLHLEEHLDAATIVGSEVPDDIPEPVEWRFDEPQTDWKPAVPIAAQWEAVKPVRADDALRLRLTGRNRAGRFGRLLGAIYVELPDWDLEDWGYVEIRARSRDPIRRFGLSFNYTEEDPHRRGAMPFYSLGDRAPPVSDGTVQTYRLSLHDLSRMRMWEGPWTHLGIWFNSRAGEEAVTLDLLSVRWEDPYLTTPLNAERPDLVEKYRAFLEEQFKANEMLRELIGGGGTVELSPEQLERLRALGYIQ